MNELKTFEHVAKVIKVLIYKIGLTYKRQDLFREELLEKVAENSKVSFDQVQKDINCVNQVIAQVGEELHQHTNKQRAYRDMAMQELQAVKERMQSCLDKTHQLSTFLMTSALVSSCQEEYLRIQSALSQRQKQRVISAATENSFDSASKKVVDDPQESGTLLYRDKYYHVSEILAMRAILH